MAVTFNKPQGMKYTDMCIYIDKHFKEIKVPNENPTVESTIFQYLYHIIYALSCKAGYFKNFADYDSFSMYAASELYISMRNKLQNEGKEVRGKVVVPVKSCLNFIKATMFPLKVNYQKDNFATVFDPAIHEGADALYESMREDVQAQYRPDALETYTDAMRLVPGFIKKFIAESPFKNDPVMCRRLYLSAILTLLNDITIPNKLKEKITAKEEKMNSDKRTEKMTNAYKANQEPAILWHIDEQIDNYIRLLVVKAKKEFSKELQYYLHENDLSDEMLDGIMKSAYDNYDDTGDLD